MSLTSGLTMASPSINFSARRSFLFEDQSLYYYIPRILTLFFGDRHFTYREQTWQWLEGLSGTIHLRRV